MMTSPTTLQKLQVVPETEDDTDLVVSKLRERELCMRH